MFDIGAPELLVIVIVAILAIGPKDMPFALRTAGRWIGKVRRVSTHFKSGIETMIREAEMEEMDRKWKAQNEAIMAAHPEGETVDDSAGADPSNAGLSSDGPQMLPIEPGPRSNRQRTGDAVSFAHSPRPTSGEADVRQFAGDPADDHADDPGRGTVPPPP